MAAEMRSASIRATRALTGTPSRSAACRSRSQNSGSRLIEVLCPAISTDRLTGGWYNSATGSVHVLPAVDRDRRAGDEAGVLRGEESDPAGDLVGVAEPPHRDSRDDLLEHVLRHRGDHVGVDVARCARVDSHAEARAFLRQRLGEAMDAALGRGVIVLAVLPGLSVDRADVDDPAPAALLHAREARLGHVEAAAEV